MVVVTFLFGVGGKYGLVSRANMRKDAVGAVAERCETGGLW